MAENKLASPKSILIFVIVLFVLIASLSVASYLSSVKKSPLSTVQPTITPTPEPTVIPTPAPNSDITTWKNYRNEKAGFSLNYPGEWGSVETEEFRKAIYGTGEEFYVKFTNNSFGINISGNTADFTPYENPLPIYLGGDPLKYCKEMEKQVFSLEGCKEVNKDIAAVSFGFYLGSGMFGDGKEINFFRQAFINNQSNKYAAVTISLVFSPYQNDKLVEMTESQVGDIAKIQLPNLDKKTIDIFDQIISTFKFIEREKATGWNIYRNDEYGFEFEYDSSWQSEEQDNSIELKPIVNDKPEEISISVNTITNRPKEYTLASWLLQRGTENDVCDFTKTINKIDWCGVNTERFEAVRLDDYAITKNNIDYDVQFRVAYGRQRSDYYISDKELSKEISVLNQILSTFKFIE